MISSNYAALLALLFIGLSIRVIILRNRYKVSLGTADNPALLRATRAHANFVEYVPIALILTLFLETTVKNLEASNTVIHISCLLLIAGRILHAYGVSQVKERLIFRVSGMALTFSTLLISAGSLLYLSS